jgi:8-oxo-dGTP diphosphatase
MIERIHVVAAVILDPQKNILLARRPQDKHQGGLWEFPGGKVEVDEAVAEALIRELQEELAITPLETAPLITVQHDYVDKSVLLDVWWVTAFDGQPHGCEGQPIEWVGVAQLDNYEFPAANLAIVDAIKKAFS